MSFGKMFSTLALTILKLFITIKTSKTISLIFQCNSNLRVGNKTFFIKAWYENGIKVLQDFFDEDWNLECLNFLNARTTSGIYVLCNVIVSQQKI